MVENCQQFERRIQALMDARIDPETDEAICSHTAICNDCYQSMMAYSLMHTSYLNDSDSMKIKLENLGLHEASFRYAQNQIPNRKYLFTVAASIAALVLIFAALGQMAFPPFKDQTAKVHTSRVSDPAILSSNSGATVGSFVRPKFTGELPTRKEPANSFENVDFVSFVEIKRSLDQNEIYASLSELPGFQPFKTLANCLDWFHQSFSGPANGEGEGNAKSPGLGGHHELKFNLQYSSFLRLANLS